jgi:hypothetical protein
VPAPIEPEDDPPADMGAVRDASPQAPDLGLVKCGVGPTGLPTCPSTDFYCWPDGYCHPCGFNGDYCCMDKMSKNYCMPGNRCSGECPTAYAKSTRCEDENCGFVGKACCWRWEKYGLCGNAQPREICNFGTCVDHTCVMK